jgi:uncharacterized delta-60 repeat protein
MARVLRRACLTFALLVAVAARAAPDDLDPTFGDGGVARIPAARWISDAALFPDGGLAAAVGWQGGGSGALRLDVNGNVDTTFAPIAALAGTHVSAVAVSKDGRLTAFHDGAACLVGRLGVTRSLRTGLPDASFGLSGAWEGGCICCTLGGNIALDAANDIHFGESGGRFQFLQTSVQRLAASGTRVDTLGEIRVSDGYLPWTYGRVAVQPDGRLVAAVTAGSIYASGLRVVRLVGSVPDPGFGASGMAEAKTPLPVLSGSGAADVAIAPDGSVVVAGVGMTFSGQQLVVARFAQDGKVDTSFGSDGLAYVDAAHTGETMETARIVVQSDGKIVVGGTVLGTMAPNVLFRRIAVARLTKEGRLDTQFAPGGVTSFWRDAGSAVSFLLVRSDGRIVVGGSSPDVFQLQGGDAAVDRPFRQRKAVEYFHAAYGHYFMTADEPEIALLDTSPAGGWLRTDQSFNVYDQATAPLVPVCRFWSGQSFAPKSSHFYTPYADECAQVKLDPAWLFERNAFYVRMPEGMSGARTCPSGTRPLYRAYNDGKGGAPNHRYTTDLAVLDEMIAKGWIMEGEAATRVFACVPLQD